MSDLQYVRWSYEWYRDDLGRWIEPDIRDRQLWDTEDDARYWASRSRHKTRIVQLTTTVRQCQSELRNLHGASRSSSPTPKGYISPTSDKFGFPDDKSKQNR